MKRKKSLVDDPRPKKDHPNLKHLELIRRQVLDRDHNRCHTCNCEEDLELHHRTYQQFGNERVDDMIILCKECHIAITDSIRRRRYSKRRLPRFVNYKKISKQKFKDNVIIKIELQDYRNSSPYHAQQRTSRSSEQF